MRSRAVARDFVTRIRCQPPRTDRKTGRPTHRNAQAFTHTHTLKHSQAYLGGYEKASDAAEAYDTVLLAVKGDAAAGLTNYPPARCVRVVLVCAFHCGMCMFARTHAGRRERMRRALRAHVTCRESGHRARPAQGGRRRAAAP